MKTDELKITQAPQVIADALDKIELIAQYTGMPRRDATSMRLLAEEMISATKSILSAYDGRLWMENDEDTFTLHLRVAKPSDAASREKLIALSKEGKATPAKGLFSRLGSALEQILLQDDGIGGVDAFTEYSMFSEGMQGAGAIYTYHYLPWAGQQAKSDGGQPKDELAGIEKSIIDSIVDDILVTLHVGYVEITAVKKLK